MPQIPTMLSDYLEDLCPAFSAQNPITLANNPILFIAQWQSEKSHKIPEVQNVERNVLPHYEGKRMGDRNDSPHLDLDNKENIPRSANEPTRKKSSLKNI